MPQDRKKFRLPLDEFEGLFDGFFDKKVQEILCAWRAEVFPTWEPPAGEREGFRFAFPLLMYAAAVEMARAENPAEFAAEFGDLFRHDGKLAGELLAALSVWWEKGENLIVTVGRGRNFGYPTDEVKPEREPWAAVATRYEEIAAARNKDSSSPRYKMNPKADAAAKMRSMWGTEAGDSAAIVGTWNDHFAAYWEYFTQEAD